MNYWVLAIQENVFLFQIMCKPKLYDQPFAREWPKNALKFLVMCFALVIKYGHTLNVENLNLITFQNNQALITQYELLNAKI